MKSGSRAARGCGRPTNLDVWPADRTRTLCIAACYCVRLWRKDQAATPENRTSALSQIPLKGQTCGFGNGAQLMSHWHTEPALCHFPSFNSHFSFAPLRRRRTDTIAFVRARLKPTLETVAYSVEGKMPSDPPACNRAMVSSASISDSRMKLYWMFIGNAC
jgi:hypothetical protein